MLNYSTRRGFLTGAGALAAFGVTGGFGIAESLPGVQFGYAAITWGNEEKRAAEEIAAVGFKGVQFRLNAVTDFPPTQMRELVAANKLKFVALSSGEFSLDAPEAEQIAKHVANAKYVKESGGLYMQILDQLKGHPRTATPEECKRLGRVLTEIGKQTADVGVPLGYHNHLNTLSEDPANLDRILEASDPRYVKLELDVAHLVAGGGDPAKAIEQYQDRILFMHLKDVRDIPAMTPGARYPFQFVELGRGRVDLPGVIAAMRKVGFKGWAVVELDRVPDAGRTAKECAATSKEYLEKKIGVTV